MGVMVDGRWSAFWIFCGLVIFCVQVETGEILTTGKGALILRKKKLSKLKVC
jgi:hypothetical protein